MDNPISEILTPPDPNSNPAALITGGMGGDPEGESLVLIPISRDDAADWAKRVQSAKDRVKNREGGWDKLLEEYLPPDPTAPSQDVKVSIHFRNVHTKIGQLFYQIPDLILSPIGQMAATIKDPLTGMEFTNDDIIQVKRAVLNDRLGEDGIDASRLMDEVLFDNLAWAGLMCTKIGYRAYTRPVEEPRLIPDPNWVPPMMPGMAAGVTGLGLSDMPVPEPPMVQAIDPFSGEPLFDITNVPIYEDTYWCRFSPKKLLLAEELKSGRFDLESPWMGIGDFVMPEHEARSTFKIPADVPLSSSGQRDERVHEYKEDQGANSPTTGQVKGVEVWYKASMVPTRAEIADGKVEVNPQVIRQLVMIEGVPDPVVHRLSPYQTINEEGRLTADSMIGFPIHVGTLRDLADSPFPPSDVAFTNSEVRNINVHRQQSVKLRDRNIGKYGYDSGKVTPEQLTQLKNGIVGDYIAFEDGALREGIDKVIAPLLKAEPARDDVRIAMMLETDVEKTLGLGGPQVGAMDDSARTATEIATVESKSNERIGKERARAIRFYLTGVRKFDTLLQRYCDEADYVEVVGADGAKSMQRWNKETIAGRYAYKAKPDSQLKLDAAQDRAQTMKFLEIIAPYSMLVGPEAIVMTLKRLADQFGMDSTKIKMPMPVVPPVGGVPGAPGDANVGTGRLPNAPNPGAGTPAMTGNTEGAR